MFRATRGLSASILGFALLSLLSPGCKKSRADDAAPRASAVASAPAAPVASSAPSTSGAAADAGAKLPGETRGCPDGMVRVEGQYCPVVIETCLEHHQEYDNAKGDKNVSERCLRYKEPTRCFVKDKKQLAFCMDRFEYPNKVGELPRVLTSWLQAKAMCEKAGKRLCTEDEFNFACEGPEMLPHVYGFVRNDKICNIDKPYVQPDQSRQLPTYDDCPNNEFCKSEMARLDQRHKIGSVMTCVSWAGVIDMNGHVNEWVELPGKEPPNRSGLKGGWWGPVRNRCRPTVTFHKEFDYGYEAGFRCCHDTLDGTASDARAPAEPDAG